MELLLLTTGQCATCAVDDVQLGKTLQVRFLSITVFPERH